MEVGVVVDVDGSPVHWHRPPGRTTVALPDSRDLWSVIWDGRERLAGIAHSHPGSGQPGPSGTDVTTFAAIEAALGRRLRWWITSRDRLIELRWAGPEPHTYAIRDVDPETEPCVWLDELRRTSYV